MPWSKVPGNEVDECGDEEIAVVKDGDGEVEGCHETEEAADEQLAALHASESKQVDLEPPEAVKNAARLALEAKEEYDDLSDCGTGVGEDRARDIVNGNLTESDFTDGGDHETAIPDYLNSHSEDVSGITDPPSDWGEETWTDGCGPVQYALWGGTATGTGLEWAQSTAEQIEKEMSEKDCGCKDHYEREEEDSEKEGGPDVFMDPVAAQERADEIGCDGIHVHEQDGETVFMPCATHEMWQELTDEMGMEKTFDKIERLLKADVADLNEGDFVEWDSSGGTAYGMVDTIAMGETVRGSLEPEDTEHETSEDNPGVIIELVTRGEDGEVMGEGDTVFHRPEELRTINESDVPEEKSEEKKATKSAVGEMRTMSFETKQFDTKEENGEFEFSAYGAVFGNKDRGGDILEKGAFKQTINHNDGKFPLVADHKLGDLQNRLGVAYAEEDGYGVRVKGHINTDTQMGREAASHIRHAEKHDLSLGMSFGYEVVKDDYDAEKDARRLKEIKNHEFTVTQIPMNPEAEVQGVKRFLEDDDALNQLAKKVKSLLLEDADFQSSLQAGDVTREEAAPDGDSDASEIAKEIRDLAHSL